MSNTCYCYSSTVCSTPPALTNDEYNEMIANGTLESEEYIDESRAMAVEYLYRELANDSTLWINDSTYIEFMLENQGKPVAYLYDAEAYMKAAYQFDSVFINLIDSTNALIRIYTDSITIYSSGTVAGTINADSLKVIWLNHVNFLNQTVNNLKVQREASMKDNLADAKLQNDYVVNGEIPERNTAYMNEIEINYLKKENDIEYLIDNFPQIFAIASQCPYAGGTAVERARSYVALINDSIIYDDANVCLQSGIYRMTNIDSSKNESNNSILIKPNPANDKVEVNLIGKFEGVCKVEFITAFGQISLMEEMNCNETLKSINVSHLSQGIYTIKVYINNQISLINKVAIIR